MKAVAWLSHFAYSRVVTRYMGSLTITMKKRWSRLFFPKLRVNIKDNNNSPHGKSHRFLFPFSSKFPDLNVAPYVLYIYSCHETRTGPKQWAWVTCDGIREQRSARGWDQESQPWQESGITALGSGSPPFFIESGIRLIAECDND